MVMRAVAINGSPRMDKGSTARLLNAFVGGMIEGGSDVEVIQASQYKIKPCSCGKLYCWNDEPGECCIEDDMQLIYPKLREAEILILASPVYIPLPGAMQNVLNRMCPLLDPDLVKREGRTRARMRDNVSIQKIVLVATSGWWEIENMDTVLRIAREFAEDASVEFSGALLRPHVDFLFRGGELSTEGKAVLDAARRAGFELTEAGAICPETLAEVSAPLISEEAYWQS
ncbi:MAG: flavodoxin family protein [Anaerolineaceae bacterium]|jgi:Multimeric flavodoxin WrbA